MPLALADRAEQGASSVRANRVVMTGPGPPSVLRYEQHDIAAPAPHEVLIRQTAIGLNYIDIQHRTGRYALPGYPSPIGMEGAGIIEGLLPLTIIGWSDVLSGRCRCCGGRV
jgi:hypothetical protein